MKIIKIIAGTVGETEMGLNNLLQKGYVVEILFQNAFMGSTAGGSETRMVTTVSIDKKVEIK